MASTRAGAGAGDRRDRPAARHPARGGRAGAGHAARVRAGAIVRDAKDRDLLDDGPPPGRRRAPDPLLRPRPGARLHRARRPVPVRCAGDGHTPTGVLTSDADTPKESMTNAPQSQPFWKQEDSQMTPETILSAAVEHASDRKAEEIVSLDLRAIGGFADYFLI